MQFTTRLVLLAATASIASAWHFTGFSDYSYGGSEIFRQSGTTSTPNCVNVDASFNDQLSSYYWGRADAEYCEFTVWGDYNCAGPVVATSRASNVESDVDASMNDQASSFSVRCY